MGQNIIKRSVTVSGSFHRHLVAIQQAVESFASIGVRVLSPADPRVVDCFGPFIFVASDLRRSIRGVQNRHLDAIRSSCLLWLECPDGYVGSSAALEVGFAIAIGVPVFASAPPDDLTLRQYVSVVSGPRAALAALRSSTSEVVGPSLLLEPVAAIGLAHSELEALQVELTTASPSEGDPIDTRLNRLARRLSVPARNR